MSIIKRYLASFLVVIVAFASLMIPSAQSFMYDFQTGRDNVYFENMINVNAKVVEDLGEGTKSNVQIQNIGISPCFVKAMIVFTPLSKETGKIIDKKITVGDDNSFDVSIDWGDALEGAWLSVDSNLSDNNKDLGENVYPNMYIWKTPLASKATTESLIDKLTINTTEYDIKVDIILDAIYEPEIEKWCDTYGLTCSMVDNIRTLSITG